MKRNFVVPPRLPARWFLITGMLCAMATAPAYAQSEESAMLSLAVASVVGEASTPAGAAVALPLALSVGGAVLTVKAVAASASGTLYLLERASDGAQASIELAARGVAASAYGVGTAVTCSVISTGVLLLAAGEVMAFVPNAIGQALLHNERL